MNEETKVEVKEEDPLDRVKRSPLNDFLEPEKEESLHG